MKTTLIVTLVLAVFAGMLFGCGAASFDPVYTYENAKEYSSGAGTIGDEVHSLDIDWRAGSVNILYHDEDHIAVAEEAERVLGSDSELHYRLDRGTLRIRYAASGRLSFRGEKSLTVFLPEGTSLRELSVETVSADVYGEDVSAENMSIESVSGDIRVSSPRETRDFEADTVSGDIELYLPADAAFELEADTVSGDFYTDFACTQRGNTYTCGMGGVELDMETVSGNMSILIAG